MSSSKLRWVFGVLEHVHVYVLILANLFQGC